jgi:flagellar hook-associated protein 1 FlgK
VLSVSANGGNGIVIQDDATTPSSRGGFGVSQFFGLNDLFQSTVPNILSTGLSGADASGLAAGSSFQLVLKGPNGDIAKTSTVNITGGMTIADVVSAMNTAMGGAVTYTLGSDGSISEAISAGYSGYQVNVSADNTERGSTGLGFSQIFGIGANTRVQQAASFAMNPAIANSPQRLAFAKSTITSSTTVGASIIGHGDSSGALALQNISTAQQSFAAASDLGAQVSTLSDYAGAFYQDVATRSNAAKTIGSAQNDRLLEAESRQSQTSGVNLDEELSNMMTYQQGYNAAARMLQVVQELYDALFQIR